MNTANSQVFLYNNEPVTFQLEGESKMVNATQMAKPFNKRVANWLQGKQTQELITILSAETGIPASGLVVTNKGGINQQGTWLHIDLALIFAQWLSPRFYFWCNAKVMELMNNGYALSEEFKQQMSEQIQTLCLGMEKLKESHAAVLKRNEELESIIRNGIERPKPLPAHSYQRTYTITSIARELGILPEELNDHLRRNWVQHKIDGFWELQPEYQGQGYAITKYGTNDYVETDGSYHEIPYHYLVWTKKGKEMILDLYEMYE